MLLHGWQYFCFALPGKMPSSLNDLQNRTNMSILRTQIEFRFISTMKGFSPIITLAIAAFVVTALFSCQKEKEPAGILSKEEMVRVMTEVYFLEERVTRMNLSPDSARNVFEIVSGRISEKTGIEDSVFRASFDYYMDRPKEMELIYSALVDSLQLKEQRTPDRQGVQ
jgi:hypothetical protein